MEFPQSPIAAQAQYRLVQQYKLQAVRNPRMRELCVREFQRLIELFPDSEHVPEGLSMIAAYYEGTGDHEQALDYARRLVSSYAASSYVEEGVIAEGKALMNLGRRREAVVVFRKVMFDNPDAGGEVEPLIEQCEEALRKKETGAEE